MLKFGTFIRRQREIRLRTDPSFSVRQLAARIGVEPSYLSKVERNLESPPSESKIRALARELDEDPDALLARAGKVSLDLQIAIRRRPLLYPKLIRGLKNLPSKDVMQLVRRVQSGTTQGRAHDRTKQ